MIPKLYSGSDAWHLSSNDSWRDAGLQDSETNIHPLTVICVKKDINGNNETCEDIDECRLGYCGYGNCSNNPGSYNCTCPDGFLQGKSNKQCQTCEREGFEPNNQFEPCQDIDECANFDCGEGTCQNDIGSHTCLCNEGFFNVINDTSAVCGKYNAFRLYLHLFYISS